MRFKFYDESIANVPKLSVDGTVGNSIHFSHWQGNETPPELRADTSTEIALNLVAASNREEFARGIDLVTNNHFDTDGLLSVWTVLTGERALELRDKLIAAAEAGCYSMALSANLEKAGHPAKRISTTATVKLEMVGGGPKITTIDVNTEAEVPGIDEAKFQEQAEHTKKTCPVSVVLAGAQINLDAKLV